MTMKTTTIALASLFLLLREGSFFSKGFQIQPPLTVRHSVVARTPRFSSSSTQENVVLTDDSKESKQEDDSNTPHSIRAPLKFLGPYPALGLRFPNIATAAQRARNESGVTLDFVLDTAANVNTINLQVAQQLNLTVLGQALPGVGSAGPIQGQDLPTYFLGDAQLEGLGNDVFMQNLTAAALPIASPASAGLLSCAFFQSIPGGITFDWNGGSGSGDAQQESPPSLTFWDTEEAALTHATQNELQRVSIDRISITQLPSVKVEINGHVFPALLDTGSPITVLNRAAAQQAGIATVVEDAAATKSRNPLAALKGKWQQAQAAAEGKVLTIMGAGGKPVNLIQSTDEYNLRMPADDDDDADSIDFGPTHIYVGNLPGLAALQGLGVDAPPAVVLGMDVLRKKRHMLFRPLENEVWF